MSITILTGDCRELLSTLDTGSVQTCVTSPPYFGLRDYGVAGQIGLEPTVEAFVSELVAVFREVRRVLTDDGTLWLNLGSSYANDTKWGGSSGGKHVKALHGNTGIGRQKVTTGYKSKDLIPIPWLVALALQQDGWYLRSDIIWAKPNPMPESVTDRPTKAHEYLFLLSKLARYYYDAAAIAEPATPDGIARRERADLRQKDGWAEAYHGTPPKGLASSESTGMRNKRSVWTVATQPFSEAHFATFPPALIEPCIKAGSREGDTVLDPFGGAGTTGLVADRLGRNAVLMELNSEYAAMAEQRIAKDAPLLAWASNQAQAALL